MSIGEIEESVFYESSNKKKNSLMRCMPVCRNSHILSRSLQTVQLLYERFLVRNESFVDVRQLLLMFELLTKIGLLQILPHINHGLERVVDLARFRFMVRIKTIVVHILPSRRTELHSRFVHGMDKVGGEQVPWVGGSRQYDLLLSITRCNLRCDGGAGGAGR